MIDRSGKTHGCPGAGSDPRLFPRFTCWLQRLGSFHSETEPLSLMVAFPPFVVLNVPIPHRLAQFLHRKSLPLGRNWYLMARLGFRYDRNWHGYIFPEAAIKVLDHTVHY